jgi:hypothetical protein
LKKSISIRRWMPDRFTAVKVRCAVFRGMPDVLDKDGYEQVLGKPGKSRIKSGPCPLSESEALRGCGRVVAGRSAELAGRAGSICPGVSVRVVDSPSASSGDVLILSGAAETTAALMRAAAGAGHRVRQVESVESACAAVDAQRPDLICVPLDAAQHAPALAACRRLGDHARGRAGALLLYGDCSPQPLPAEYFDAGVATSSR